jgi:hypothetical protein
MIYINNFGWRFSNQQFQIACAASLALKHGDTDGFVVPEWKYNKYMKNPVKIQNPPYVASSVYDEGNSFHYRDIPYHKNMAISGYWQSEKYFKPFESYIRHLFEPSDEVVSLLKSKYSDIITSDNTCSIHVRRGDYLSHPNHHPAVSLTYCMKAVRQFPKDTKFIVFSDDQKWCKENFMGEMFLFPEPQEDIYDFFLMSMCKNNIIANSSFSWWAAWLNKNPDKKIIAPSKWFGDAYSHYDLSDLIPSEWIKI